jgi:serine protease inhibitor
MQFVFRKNMLILQLLAAIIVVSGCLVGCTRKQETETRPDSRNLKNSASTFIYNMIPENAGADISSAYTVAVNTFSVNLLDKIYSNDSYRGKNVVISPFCISRNLAIITEAATGASQKELLDVLGGSVALDDATSALSRLLYADKSVILQVADAIWVDSTRYSLLPSFRDTANKKYGVEAAGLDFDNVPASVNAINRWIAVNTSNCITNAVKESYFDPLTALFVTSTIYFEADWTSPFGVTKTASYPFSTPAGMVQVQMMASSYRHQTRKTGEYENAKLYYGTDKKDFFYLDIYMPVTISMEEFIGQKCLAALAVRDSFGYGGLRMPKFCFENEIDLKPVLQNMGITGAFDPNVSEITGMAFDKVSRENSALYIQLIRHIAGIKTDEEGTVAYAVTVTAMGAGAAEVSPDVVLDRPFVYFIRAGESGLVLFAGVVNNPNETAR